MASAQHTPNLNLTQYSDNGTDKVSLMGDYNSDMDKIDKNVDTVNSNIADAKKAGTDAMEKAKEAKSEADSLSQSKEDKGIAYSKAETDEKLSSINNTISDVENSVSTVDGKFANYYNKNDSDSRYYSKTDANSKFQTIAGMPIVQDSIVTIGDSYMYGSELSDPANNSMAKVCADSLGLKLYNYAVPGSGFLLGGDSNRTFSQQADAASQDSSIDKRKVKYVLIAGGRNDGGAAVNDLNGYCTNMINTMWSARNNFPYSEVVFVPGMWDNGWMAQDYARAYDKSMSLATPRHCHVIGGAYTWGFGWSARSFNDIHPAETLAILYGEKLADACTSLSSVYCDRVFVASGQNGWDTSGNSVRLSVAGGTAHLKVRAKRQSASGPHDIASFDTLGLFGVWVPFVGLNDTGDIVPVFKFDGANVSLDGTIFGTPRDNDYYNGDIAVNLIGSI